MRRLLPLLFIPILGSISLDEAMTREEKARTGVSDLNYSQKQQLENWLNANFEQKENSEKTEQLYLSLNIDNGSKLELSNGTTYEIDPDDRLYSMYWITPFPVRLSKSDHHDYPVKITNMNTGTSVNGRQISTSKLIEKEHQKALQQPSQPKQKSTPQDQQKVPSSPQKSSPPGQTKQPQSKTAPSENTTQ